MQVITENINNDMYIEDDTVLDGIIAGSAIVRPGKTLVVNGVVTGNVVIEENGTVELNGIVSGDVLNQGGTFTQQGVLAGNIHNTNK